MVNMREYTLLTAPLGGINSSLQEVNMKEEWC